MRRMIQYAKKVIARIFMYVHKASHPQIQAHNAYTHTQRERVGATERETEREREREGAPARAPHGCQQCCTKQVRSVRCGSTKEGVHRIRNCSRCWCPSRSLRGAGQADRWHGRRLCRRLACCQTAIGCPGTSHLQLCRQDAHASRTHYEMRAGKIDPKQPVRSAGEEATWRGCWHGQAAHVLYLGSRSTMHPCRSDKLGTSPSRRTAVEQHSRQAKFRQKRKVRLQGTQ